MQETTDTAPLIELSDLQAGYPGQPVLDAVSLRIEAGQLVSLVGPNGAGKTTLLKVIAGLLSPLAGEVRVLGGKAAAARPRIAYVPQRNAIDWKFPVTVREVVLMARYGKLGLMRRPSQADQAVVDSALARAGLTDLQGKQIGALSGGQQQRVFLARALAQEARLLLLDEPFNGVDPTTESILVETLVALRDMGRAAIVSTHDLNRARQPFDRALLLNRQVVAFGPPAVVFSTDTLRRTFGGQMLVLDDGEALLIRGHER